MPSFPTQPTVGEIFTFGQYSWQWTGTYWQPYVSSSTSFTAITSVGNGYSIINNTTGTTLELRSFSGVNITIITGTSGTLTFSASTGGGGGGGSGSSGTSGLSFGSSGTSGLNGSSGTSGNSGSSGTSGVNGTSGTSGNSGSSGTSGENGTSGNSGSSGTSGTSPDISGTINYIPKFTGATSLGNSLIYDDGTNLGIGTASPSAKLDIITPSSSSIGLRISGDSTTDLVRITQTGSGAAFRVEDSDNPDSTPFVISGDGKVYIGTTTETTSVLNVGGNSHFYGNIFLNGTTNRAIQNSTAGRALINFATAGDSYFNNGNLGIGTISPGSKLDIDASTGSTIGIRVTGGTSVDMVRITQTGSGNAIVVEDETNPDATPFVVAADGRVGIGLTAPLSSYKLHVRNGTATNSVAAAGTVATFESSGVTYITVLSPDSLNGGLIYGSNSDRFGAYHIWNHDNNALYIATAKSGATMRFLTDEQTERMRIDSSGNVGIGTTSMFAKLDVNVSTGGTIGVRISGDSSSDMLRVTQTGSGNAIIVEDSSNPDSTPFVVTSGGTVGVGITIPDSLLHIHNGSAGSVSSIGGTTVTIENNSTNYLSLLSSDSNLSGIVFGSPSDSFGSFIRWGHTSGKLEISTANSNDYIQFGVENAVTKAYVTNTGFGINTLPSQTLDVSGNTLISGTLTATTISATTYQNLPGSSSSNCFGTFYTSAISGCSPVTILTPLNVTEGLNVTGTTVIQSLSATSFSASTYQGDVVTQITAGSGINVDQSTGNVTITATGGGGGLTFQQVQMVAFLSS